MNRFPTPTIFILIILLLTACTATDTLPEYQTVTYVIQPTQTPAPPPQETIEQSHPQNTPFDPIAAWFTDPLIITDTLYIASNWFDHDRTSDTYLYALDSQTGHLRWQIPAPGLSGHLLAADNLIYYSDAQNIYALNGRSGQTIWQTPVPANPITLTLIDHLLYLANGRILRTLDPQTGQQQSQQRLDHTIDSPILADQSSLYFASGPHLIALDRQTNQPRWHFQTDSQPLYPIIADNTLYFGSADRHLYALNAQTGDLLWKYQILGTYTGVGYPEPTTPPATQPDQGLLVFAPTRYEDTIYVGSDDYHLYAIDTQTGQLNWRFKTSAPVVRPATIANDHLYLASDDGTLYLLNPQTGQTIQQPYTVGPTATAPTITNSTLYLATTLGQLHALNPQTLLPLWQFHSPCTLNQITCP